MLHKIGQLLSGITLTILVVACLVLVAPRIFGVQLFSVLSGSMEPAFSVNDLVYAFPASYEDIEVGDPITFKLNENTIVTHRVIEKDDAQQSLHTKGDANETADGTPTPYSDVIGVVRFYIPRIGGALQAISSGSGRIIAMTAAAFIILLTLLLTINGQPDCEEDEQPKASKRSRAGERRERGPAQRGGSRPLDGEWELDGGGLEAPGRRGKQRYATAGAGQWEREALRQQAVAERQGARPKRSRVSYEAEEDWQAVAERQGVRPKRSRVSYEAEEDWQTMAEPPGRYAGRPAPSPRQPVRRVQYSDDRREEDIQEARARQASQRAGVGAARSRGQVVLFEENSRRRVDVPERPEKRKRTGRQIKTQLPPAWR